MIEARACCRIDLAGGTLDIWPLGLLHPGSCTVNVAIDLPVTVALTRRAAGYRVLQQEEQLEAATAAGLQAYPGGALLGVIAEGLGLPPMEVTLHSGSPRGGGLGASSSMTVALIAAAEALLDQPASSPQRLAAMARDLEAQLMHLPTGTQDHFAPLLGGALCLTYPPGGVAARRLEIDLEALGECLVIAYTGQSHFSAGSNWQVVRRRLDGEAESVELFTGIAETAQELAGAVETGDLERTGLLMGQEWSFRRRLADGISTPAIERILQAALGAGAWGGKACGAGGGGCVAVLAPPERRAAVARAMEKAGGALLTAKPCGDPLVVQSRP
jgi:D-glycero-alpha-D-manno-heptose-7-phosphate kinase